MKIRELEEAVQDFISTENIKVIGGCVVNEDAEKIEIFMDCLKKKFKSDARFNKKEPMAIGLIIENVLKNNKRREK